MALYISDQFGEAYMDEYQEAVTTADEISEADALVEEPIPQQDTMQVAGTTDTKEDAGKDGKQEEKEVHRNPVLNDIAQCNQSILSIIETIIAGCDDMNPLCRRVERLQRFTTTLWEQRYINNMKATQEGLPGDGENPGFLIILDSLLTKVDKAVDTTSKGLVDLIEKHLSTKAQRDTTSPKKEQSPKQGKRGR